MQLEQRTQAAESKDSKNLYWLQIRLQTRRRQADLAESGAVDGTPLLLLLLLHPQGMRQVGQQRERWSMGEQGTGV